MTTTLTSRRPSPLQRRILILLAGLAQRGTLRVRTRDLELLLSQAEERSVYGNNVRDSCRRMEASGWLRTLRASNLQLAVELTEAGQTLAAPLLAAEQERAQALVRADTVVMLPFCQPANRQSDGQASVDRLVRLDGVWHTACRGAFVVRLAGSTCLQLWNAAGQLRRMEGDPLQVARWLQACDAAGLALQVQINESDTPATPPALAGEATDPDSRAQAATAAWYRELLSVLRAHQVSGTGDDDERGFLQPGNRQAALPVQERFLALADGMRGRTEALKAERDEDTTRGPLCEALAALGFSSGQVARLMRIIDWPAAETEAQQREALADLLRELAARGIDGDREKLMTLIFSPVRRPEETWRGRLQWLLGGELAAEFRFCSHLTREQAGPALDWLADTLGQHGVSHFARAVRWADGTALPD